MNYCIFCHNQGKDSCSKGYKDKKTGGYQKSATDVTQTGCPLEEHISEMNELKAKGVNFEHYDNLPGLTRKGDIHHADGLTVAWFKDPAGNILSVQNRATG